MKNKETLIHIAEKSNQMLDKQINSYRQKHTNSASVITILALFLPFFLNGLKESNNFIKFFSLIPIILLILSLIIFIQILKGKPLNHGVHPKKFDDLVNNKYEQALIYEIGVNKSSYIDNEPIYEQANIRYNCAIKLTVIAIISSTILLSIDMIHSSEQRPIKPIIQIFMPKNSKDSKEEKKIIIPTVPPTERAILNEGTEKPKIIGKSNEKK